MTVHKWSLSRARKASKHVDGWLNPQEGEILYSLARNCKGRGAIVEVGSWKGKSTIFLAMGSLAGSKAKVYAIDPHTGDPEHHAHMGKVWTFGDFKKNIRAAGVTSVVKPLVATSMAAARKFKEPVELLFIDGLHDYTNVRQDFNAWFPKLVDGGFVVFHDSASGRFPGIERFVRETSLSSDDLCLKGLRHTATFAQKAPVSFNARLFNVYILSIRDTWTFLRRFKCFRFLKPVWRKIRG